MQNKRNKGKIYEKRAGEFLSELGYEILTYNYSCKIGEIDIIAKKSVTIIFVEVKYRYSNKMGNSLEAVGYRKQKVISKCAAYYIAVNYDSDINYRFDVIGFEAEQLIHIENAFEYIE